VQRREPAELVRTLSRMPDLRWLHATLTVRRPSEDGLGLHGSGLFVVNPPWTLPATMEACLPWLTDVLGQDDGARWTLDATAL
jgi:23S rRNA (adenine2030-N6)-methyltransferase